MANIKNKLESTISDQHMIRASGLKVLVNIFMDVFSKLSMLLHIVLTRKFFEKNAY